METGTRSTRHSEMTPPGVNVTVCLVMTVMVISNGVHMGRR